MERRREESGRGGLKAEIPRRETEGQSETERHTFAVVNHRG